MWVRCADRAHALEHARWSAGVDDRFGVALELGEEQVGDEPVVARGAVVACHARPVEQRRALRAGTVAKAQ